MTKTSTRKQKILKYSLLSIGSIFGLGILFILSVYLQFWGPIPSKKQLTEIKQSRASEVYAAGGELIGKHYIFDRQPITYEDLPQHLVNALIATEDARFYDHNGIDKRSMFRVLFRSILLQDASSGGGSTISQQLAKNLYPRKDYSIFSMPVNKTREAVIARRLENNYSKEEIITLYFNTVSIGDNTYGIESAAMKFFNKKTQDLTKTEAAVLVGMLKNPNLFNPRIHPERSRERRDVVLSQMFNYGYLSKEELIIEKNKPLELSYRSFSHNAGLAPYFREQVRKEVKAWAESHKDENGEPYNLYTSGLKIYTTLDFEMQQMAEAAMEEHMTDLQSQFEKSYGKGAPWLSNKQIISSAIAKTPKYRSLKASGKTEKEIMDSLSIPYEMELFDWGGKKIEKISPIDSVKHYLKFLNAGMLSIDPRTGAIRSWIGGIDFNNFKYDHVSQSKRQVGSTFKPFVYTAALEAGLDPCKHYSGEQVTYVDFNNWTPTNSGAEPGYDLNYSMKAALSNSVNTVAVKVLDDAGLQNVITQAHKMGITSELPEVPSIALGTAEISILEMAEAYSSFVNAGHHAKPYFITRIEDSKGRVIAEFKPEISTEPSISEETREIMIEMMKATVNEGTATRLRWKYGLKNDIAGKTGTTQSNKDGWFVGLTPKMVTVTWVGSDDHRIGFRTTNLGQGASSALPIYALMMQRMNKNSAYRSITDARFPPPSMDVMNKLACAPTQEDGLLKRLFTNNDKPKPMKFKDNTEGEEKEKEGLFKKIGNLFKSKKKKDN